jgi:hypothetical protein
MYRTILIVGFLAVGLMAAIASAQDRKTEDKGITLDGLGRGLKSAAHNVEKEIPKVGSAIGSAIKKITEAGSGSGKSSSQEPVKQNK